MLTQERLKELLNYDPDTGIFTWMLTGSGRRRNLIAGAKSHGYLSIGIDGSLYLAHRLAFLFVDGLLPKESVDHINHNPLDNRIRNLRCVTHSENHKNRKFSQKNTTKVTGVFFDKRYKSWYSEIYNEKKKVYLISTKDFFEAVCARKSAENKYNYHENHGINMPEDV